MSIARPHFLSESPGEHENFLIFLSESIRTARSLPMAEAVKYLNGLLLACSDNEATRHLRKVYVALSESDRQLKLIEDRQLRFNLTTDN